MLWPERFRSPHRAVPFGSRPTAPAESDLRTLAAELIRRALRTGGERPVAADEQQAVADALATTLQPSATRR
ncbi:hypothetical protein ACFV2Q_06470 [Streptomyces sp. NPDC059650]|uniref:hypothetical protein n=1 Tax=Streptomyces sp. NPDC059650 TaxID=3346896 RepID=UPI0036759B78